MAIDPQQLPWVISVDDHVIEPAHVWQRWLPAKFRDRGPRIEQDTCATRLSTVGLTATYEKGGDGPVVDWWVFEDIIRPLPLVAACAGFSRQELTLAPVPFSAIRPGCYDPKARLGDMDINRTERSMCFPTFPRFCGQLFTEAKDRQLGLACLQAYNDWMVEEWCGDSNGHLEP
ncbi:MAG TPA: amidohydrolase, partial [Ilumatobacteraceae bacterium]|nr:amidohydrolase [Ilumatobacteraceae bacterium]